MRYKRTGWFNESYRHYLAAKGVKTSYFSKRREGWRSEAEGLRVAGPAVTTRTRPRKIFETEEFLKMLAVSKDPKKNAEYMKLRSRMAELKEEIDVRSPKSMAYSKPGLLMRGKQILTPAKLNALEEDAQVKIGSASSTEELAAAQQMLGEIQKMREDVKIASELGKELREKQKAADELAGVKAESLGVSAGWLTPSQWLSKEEQGYVIKKGTKDPDTGEVFTQDIFVPGTIPTSEQKKIAGMRGAEAAEKLQELAERKGSKLTKEEIKEGLLKSLPEVPAEVVTSFTRMTLNPKFRTAKVVEERRKELLKQAESLQAKHMDAQPSSPEYLVATRPSSGLKREVRERYERRAEEAKERAERKEAAEKTKTEAGLQKEKEALESVMSPIEEEKK